jgi:hypothetical protein
MGQVGLVRNIHKKTEETLVYLGEPYSMIMNSKM